MDQKDISLNAAVFFGLSSFMWLTTARFHLTTHPLTSDIDDSTNVAIKGELPRISIPSLESTTLDKVCSVTNDPLVQIECEIIQSEIHPVVERINSHKMVFGNFQPLVIGIAGGSGSGKTNDSMV